VRLIVAKHLLIIPMPLHFKHEAHFHEGSNMHHLFEHVQFIWTCHIQNNKIYLNSPIIFGHQHGCFTWCHPSLATEYCSVHIHSLHSSAIFIVKSLNGTCFSLQWLTSIHDSC